MDTGMPMMPDPSTGGMPATMPGAAAAPQIDPRKLAMIRNILMQRMQQGGGMGGGMQPGMPSAPMMQPPGGRLFNPNSMQGPRG